MPFFALIVAAFWALVACPVPPKALFTVPRLLWTIIWYLPLPWAAAVGVMALFGRRSIDWPIAATAVWFGPLCVLLRTAPEWTPAPVALWTLHLASTLIISPPPKHRLLSVFAALSIQGVVILIALGQTARAAAAIMVPAAILAWGFAPIRLSWARPAIALAILLLALVPMSDYLLQPVSSGAGGAPLLKGREMPDSAGKKADTASPREVHRGVILWPPKVRQGKIVAPVPPATRRTLSIRSAVTRRIPFAGVYWFFHPPFLQIPKDSFTEHGAPTEKSYRSTGGLPMVMEAHQHLGTVVPLTCCRAIQVEFTNAEPLGGETLLELVLGDTGSKRRMTLGLLPVDSTGVSGIPRTQVLTFRLPGSPRIRQFDAVAVRFHRPQFRRTRSARISLQSFVLVPPI
jgi:hypothetical protein